MIQTWIYAIGSVLLVSLVSFAGLFTLSLKMDKLMKVLLYLVSFSAGALLGGAFIHLLPEAIEMSGGMTLQISLFVLSGLLGFFAIEKFIHWRHCHIPTSSEHPHHLGTMNLVGDGVHNLIDGLIIGASYLASIPIGISTTIAVVLHEIPQEIGDFGVLVHSGMKRGKALMLNFLIALTALAGTIISLVIGGMFDSLIQFLLPFTAGGFIYIATADLIPELKKECSMGKSFGQLVSILLGVGVMMLTLLL